jgi:uncharacterized membrane protein YraQ (UPF0718 family)
MEHGFFAILWEYLVVTSPFLLLGLFIAGFIHVYIPLDKLGEYLKTHKWKSIFYSSLLGVPLPLCSCAVIPTAITLRKNGSSNGATSSFLITTPESGVDSIAVTYSLMDLPMAIIRPIAAFCSGITAGALNNLFNDWVPEVQAEATEKKCCPKTKVKQQAESKFKKALKYGMFELLDDISGWLGIGLIVGTLVSLYFPESYFYQFSSDLSKLIIIAISVPMYICASATTPIAAGLMLKGATPGTVLILLLLGPATNISNILVLQKYIGKKGVILNLIAIIVVSIAFSYLVDFGYQNWWPAEFNFKDHLHEHGASLFEIFGTCLFLVLLLASYYRKYLKSSPHIHSH